MSIHLLTRNMGQGSKEHVLDRDSLMKEVVRNLGILFDSKFSFTNHVNSIIKSCFANLQDLHHI